MKTTLCLIVALCVASHVRFTHAQITVSAPSVTLNAANIMLNGSFVTDNTYNVSGTCSNFAISFASGSNAFAVAATLSAPAAVVNYFSAAPVCQSSSHAGTFTWTSTASVARMTIASSSTTILAGTTINWFCTGAMLPRAVVTAGLCVVASPNPHQPVCRDTIALGGEVTAVAFTIAAGDRIPDATGKAVTLAFKPASGCAAADTITLNYPSGFFGAAVPTLDTAGAAKLTIAAPGATSVVMTVKADQTLAAATAVTITLSGVTMGAKNAGSGTGISVSTSKDYAGATAASGALGGQVTDVALTIADDNRVPSGTGKTVKLVFKPTSGCAAADTITLNYPSGFFGAAVPTLDTDNAAKLTIAAPGATSAVLTVKASQSLAAATAVTITMTGVTMGAPNAGSSTGVTVSTSKDSVSAGQPSGLIGAQFSTAGPTMTIADDNRVPGTGKQVILIFKPATAVPAAGTVTLNYPSGFFGAAVPVLDDAVGAARLTIAAPGATSVVMTVKTGQSIVNNANTQITLTGVTMGAPTAGSTTGISISSSLDFASGGSASGVIGAKTLNVAFTIAATDRVPFGTGKAVTLAYKPIAAVPATGTVTLNYPSGFFGAAVPTLDTDVGAAKLTIAAPGATSVVMTVKTGQSLTANTAVTITMTGVTMGAINAGSDTGVTVSTSLDYASDAVASGALGGTVSAVSLTLTAADRFGGMTTTGLVTVAFTPSLAMPIGTTITIVTPFNYFNTRAAAAAAGTSTITCATSACTSTTVGNVAVINVPYNTTTSTAAMGAITVVTTGAATTANAITITFGIGTFTTGLPVASSSSIKVLSTVDGVSSAASSTTLAVPTAPPSCPLTPGGDAPANSPKAPAAALTYPISLLLAFLAFLLL